MADKDGKPMYEKILQIIGAAGLGAGTGLAIGLWNWKPLLLGTTTFFLTAIIAACIDIVLDRQ